MSFMTEAHWCGHSKSLGEGGVTQFIIGLVSPDQREYMYVSDFICSTVEPEGGVTEFIIEPRPVSICTCI